MVEQIGPVELEDAQRSVLVSETEGSTLESFARSERFEMCCKRVRIVGMNRLERSPPLPLRRAVTQDLLDRSADVTENAIRIHDENDVSDVFGDDAEEFFALAQLPLTRELSGDIESSTDDHAASFDDRNGSMDLSIANPAVSRPYLCHVSDMTNLAVEPAADHVAHARALFLDDELVE